MKNYYKILGVKENASEEEIREKWIKLMRKFHPDWRTEGVPEDERVKEINEAYQTLKFSSTRMKYDLKKVYDRKKKRSYVRRLSFPISMLMALLIISTVYLKNSMNNPGVPNVLNGPNDPNEHNVLNDPNGYNDPNEPNVTNDLNVIRIDTSTHSQIDTSKPITQKTIDLSPSTLNLVTDSSSQLSKRSNIPDERSIPNKHNDLNEQNDLNKQNVPNVQNVLNDPNGNNDLNGLNVTNDLNIVRMAALTHQPSVATDQEIKQFFAHYTERYIQKDLDDFLSLFSLKAVQNHRDGWEGIRKIYRNFFSQSKDIRYCLEDTEIEFYQNGLEVKAHYELIQTLKRGDEKKTWRGRIRWVLIKEQGALKILSLDYQHQTLP